MRRSQAEAAAVGAGVITILAGTALTVTPRAIGRAVAIPRETDPGLRAIGIVDLVIAAGLLAARRRGPWLVARAAANPPSALYLAMIGRRYGSSALYPIAGLIAGLTAADLIAARTLLETDGRWEPAGP